MNTSQELGNYNHVARVIRQVGSIDILYTAAQLCVRLQAMGSAQPSDIMTQHDGSPSVNL